MYRTLDTATQDVTLFFHKHILILLSLKWAYDTSSVGSCRN